MDAITKGWIKQLSEEHPLTAITLSHQFLDGTDKHECGFVPNNWNYTRLYVDLKVT